MKPLFIVNPISGGSRGGKLVGEIEASMRRRGEAPEIVCTEGQGHAIELARRASDEGFAPVVGVGGDGTLNEIVNGLLASATPAPLAVVPSGTGNDFARCVGVPTELERALSLVGSGVERRLDLASCNGRLFLNVGGVGIDARVARTVRNIPKLLRIGSLPYIVSVLAALIRNASDDLEIHLDDDVIRRNCLTVAVANGRFYGGGMMICPDANRADGQLDVCLVDKASRREVIGLLPSMFSGGHVSHPKVEIRRATTVRIEGPVSAEVELDGELVAHLPVEFRVLPGALRVMTP